MRERLAIKEAVAELEAQRIARFSGADLDSIAMRRVLSQVHPILERNYFIETDEWSSFNRVVFDQALARKSGLYVSGEFRVGKTMAIEKSMEYLKDELPSVTTLFYSASRNANRTKNSMCREMLEWFGYPISKYQDAESTLVRFVMAAAVKAGSKSALLFIDEAHMLTVKELGYLLSIGNWLRRERFVLVTILVGQAGPAGIDSLRQLTQEEDHGAVIARFLTMPYVLGGLHSEQQLAAYLDAFDTKLFYPLDSQWSYSRFFLQKAFDAGWRLRTEAPRLWKAMLDHSGTAPSNLKQSGFRLAFVNDSVHSFLLDSMEHDKRTFKGSAEMWNEAVLGVAQSDLFI